jgi:hypothetical protein
VLEVRMALASLACLRVQYHRGTGSGKYHASSRTFGSSSSAWINCQQNGDEK